MNRKIELPAPLAAAVPIIEQLTVSGHEAVFVGGAVRDTFMGLPVKDVDIATSATPDQVLGLFPKCIPTGLQHGTVTVLHNGESYEITTYRTESAYENHRRPEEVNYIRELRGDLLRRDFTINAIALTARGETIDYFGGEADMELRIVRCVGDADARFQEDALRMLRAVRFISAYGFRPSFSTWKALLRHRNLLRHIAMERVQAELDKMLSSKRPQQALRWLAGSGLLRQLKDPIPLPDVIFRSGISARRRNMEIVPLYNGLHRVKVLDSRWAAVCLIAGIEMEQAMLAMRQLRFSNERRTRIAALLSIDAALAAAEGDKLRDACIGVIIQHGKQAVQNWMCIAPIVPAYSMQSGMDRLTHIKEIFLSVNVSTLKELQVNGREIMKHLDRKSGPWLSGLLMRLLHAAAAGELMNERNELLRQARLWSEEQSDNE